LWRLVRFYSNAVKRVKGQWAGSGATGYEFDDANHVFAADLHIFGEGSLFELLCTARTSIGRRRLAEYLLDAPVIEETLRRQEAVRELRGRWDLRESISTLGEFEFLETRHGTFDEWLNSLYLSFPKPIAVLAVFTSSLLAGIAIAGLMGILPWTSTPYGHFP
jgi:hypothetical protein